MKTKTADQIKRSTIHTIGIKIDRLTRDLSLENRPDHRYVKTRMRSRLIAERIDLRCCEARNLLNLIRCESCGRLQCGGPEGFELWQFVEISIANNRYSGQCGVCFGKECESFGKSHPE